jgi:hypothetical protein
MDEEVNLLQVEQASIRITSHLMTMTMVMMMTSCNNIKNMEMSTMLKIQMRMIVLKYINNICSNNSSSIHLVLCLHSSKSRHNR